MDTHTVKHAMLHFFGKIEDKTTGARTHPIAIGVDYAKGDDPVEGFRGEDTWSVALKIKY